jgi:N-acetylneuraminic acid mutarotase
MGGFDHEDIEGLPPSTLTSCEKITHSDDSGRLTGQGEFISHLNVPRAYAGCCHIGSVIYIFGGLSGYESLQSIE